MAHSGRLLSKTHVPRRAVMAWLAVFALFVQALAPLSAAWAFDDKSPGNVQVVCTANGIQTTLIGEDGAPIKSADGAFCPFCVLHVSSTLFSPSQASLMPAYTGLAKQAFRLPRADVHTSLWRTQPRQPRGPPHTA